MTSTLQSEQARIAEKKLQAFLETGQLPTLPVVAQKLVELCKDDMANFADFARVLETDPGLASRILRIANSAYYAQRNRATTIERAITALGLKYVKSISLGFRLASTLNELGGAGFNMEKFWEESIFRGVLARQLAQRYCPKRKEEAFLVGLLQNIGIPVLLEILGAPYASLWHDLPNSEAALAALERQVFEFDHQMAAGAVARHWCLPDMLAKPICCHHQRAFAHRSDNEEVQLAQISYFVATLSLRDRHTLCDEDLQFTAYCQEVFGLGQRAIADLLDKAKIEFQSVANMFADILPDRIDINDLLAQANAMLSKLACAGPQDVSDMNDELQLLRAQCMELAKTVTMIKEQVHTDPLTSLATRVPLENYIQKAVARVQARQTSLTVLFIDINKFKAINDLFGHNVGDYFLKELAKLLRSLFGGKGCVARFGGDEMVVALMGLDAKQAVSLAQALRLKAATIQLEVAHEGRQVIIAMSCSIGLLFCPPASEPGSFEHIIDLADQQMYQAKKADADNVCCQILPAPE